MIELHKFEALKRGGSSPADVYRAAKDAGMGDIDVIRVLRAVFGLSLEEAKEAMIVGSGTASSLHEHQKAIAEELKKRRRSE